MTRHVLQRLAWEAQLRGLSARKGNNERDVRKGNTMGFVAALVVVSLYVLLVMFND